MGAVICRSWLPIPKRWLTVGSLMILVFTGSLSAVALEDEWLLPIETGNRRNWNDISYTNIGRFGTMRKARPGIDSHLHTGIDIKRPDSDAANERVFSASLGLVVSVRSDGPFAQIIIEHRLTHGEKIWTVYEHIAGITVAPGEIVTARQPIARFMNTSELSRYGWQFNHLHFEIMKKRPLPITPSAKNPQRRFATYSLTCHTPQELNDRYYNPIEFFSRQWQQHNPDDSVN